MKASTAIAYLAAAGVASAAAVLVLRPIDPARATGAVVARATPKVMAPAPVATAALRSARARPPAAPAAPPRIEALERALAECDPTTRDRVLADQLPGLVSRDPHAAARFAELQTDARLRELSLLQVSMAWARSDDVAAVQWAESLADPAERDASIADIALAVAETRPARAVALRERFVAPAPVPDNTLVNLAQQWGQEDFEAALAWANAQPAGVQRDQVIERLVFVRAEAEDLPGAAELATTLHDAGARNSAVASVAQQWQLHDPEAARAWARGLGEADAARALSEIEAARSGT